MKLDGPIADGLWDVDHIRYLEQEREPDRIITTSRATVHCLDPPPMSKAHIPDLGKSSRYGGTVCFKPFSQVRGIM